MKYFLATLSILLCFTFAVNAQRFEAGYIVTASGDSLKGEIFRLIRSGSVKSIEFDKKVILPNPDQILAMGTANTHYVTRIVPLDMSPKSKSIKIDTLFLEVLVSGKISLLFFVDEFEKTHYFIDQGAGTPLTDLGLKFLDQGDGFHFQKLETFKDGFKKAFPSCSQLFPEIDKTKYARNNIQELFIKCYTCAFSKPPASLAVEEKTLSEFGLVAGISQVQLKFTDSPTSPGASAAAQYTFDKSTSPTAGIYLNLTFPRINRLFTLRQELVFLHTATTSAEVIESTLVQNQRSSHATISTSYLKYNLVLRQGLSYGKIRPFLNIGLSGGFLMSYEEYATTTTQAFSNPPTTTQSSMLGEVTSIDFGFFAGVGVIINRLAFELRAETSKGLQPENSYTSPVNSIHLLCSFSLLKGKK